MPKYKTTRAVTKKLLENRGKKATYCEKILGDLEGLYLLADFWERQAGLVHLIATNELLEYIDNESFDNKELDAFRCGLSMIPLFLQKCLEERQFIEKGKLKTTAPFSLPAEVVQ